MKKFLALLTVCALILGSLAGCGGDSGTPDQGGAGDTGGVAANSDITILDYAEMSSLYPLDMGTVSDAQPMFWIYDPLLRLDPNQEYVWMLATGCDTNDEGTEYTFHLREGISFSDGTPWNAEAAKANLDIMADQSHGYKSQFMYANIDRTEIVDEYTVKVYLKEVYAPFLNALAIEPAGMVSPKLLEAGDEALNTTPIGTGQYTMKERRVGEYCLYELNRDWWGYDADICGGTPLVDAGCGFNTITLRPVSEEATRVAMLMSGEANIINSLTHTNKATVEAAGKETLQKVGTSMAYFYLNCQKDVFKDVRVRQAISMAIDIDALNDVVYGGEYEKASSFLTGSINFYQPQTPYEYNIEKAKQLLTDAGYGDGLTLVCWEENDTTDIQRGEFIQQQLEKVGITLKIYPQEGGFLTDNVNAYSGDPKDTAFDCYIRGYGADTADPDEAVGRFASKALPPMGGNYSFYKNPEFDKAIEAGARSIDSDVRAEAYATAQKIIWDDVPAVALLSTCYSAAYDSHIDGLQFGPAGCFNLMKAKYVE